VIQIETFETTSPMFSPLTVTWNNTAAAFIPPIAVTILDSSNIANMAMTITDGAGSPQSALFLTEGQTQGTLDVSGAPNFFVLGVVDNQTSLIVTSVPSPTWALLLEKGSEWSSTNLTCGAIQSQDSTIADTGTITTTGPQNYSTTSIGAPTLNAAGGFTFNQATFSQACALIGPTAHFDGPSWSAFLDADGTYSPTTVVTVTGGFIAGQVPGANITGNATLSLDGVGASAGFTQGGNWYTATALPVGTSTVALNGADPGDTICITRTDATPGAILQINGLVTLTGPGTAVFRYDLGGPWKVAIVGDLTGTPPTAAPVAFIYKPGGVAGGQIFTDPWQLWLAAFLAAVPVTIYVDCSVVSPAPWPVDQFQANITFAQSPIVSNPAVLGLTAGINPFTSAPSNGSLLFINGLDGVGVVNVSSTPPFAMVQCGEIFDASFFMKNGAYITLGAPATISLGIITNGTFQLQIDNCLNPFPAAGTSFPNNPGTLDVLVTREAPSLLLPSFVGPAGAILNLRYDGSVPQSQLVEGSWAGTANLIFIGISYPLVNPSVEGITLWEPEVLAPATAAPVYSAIYTGATTVLSFTNVQIGPNLPQPNEPPSLPPPFPAPPAAGTMSVKYRLEITRTGTSVGAVFEGYWAFASNGIAAVAMGTPVQTIAVGTNAGLPPAGWVATLQVAAGQVQLVATTDAVGPCVCKATLEWSYVQ